MTSPQTGLPVHRGQRSLAPDPLAGSGRRGRGSPAPAYLGSLSGPLGPRDSMLNQRPKGLGSRPTHRWHKAGRLGRSGHVAHRAFARRGARFRGSHVRAALGPAHPAFAGDVLKECGPWLIRAPVLALQLRSQVTWVGERSLLFPFPQLQCGRCPLPS